MRKTELSPNVRAAENGYSMVELMVVIALLVIMTGVTVFSLRGNKRAYGADDEAMKILSMFREGYQRAITQRQAQRLTIDRPNNMIRLTDLGSLPGGDEITINRSVLNSQVTMDRPSVGGSPVTLPPAPYNYAEAAWGGTGAIDIFFFADGSVSNSLSVPAPLSLTVFLSPTPGSALAGRSNDNLIRAVTLYGPTASTKMWKFDTNRFIWEIN